MRLRGLNDIAGLCSRPCPDQAPARSAPPEETAADTRVIGLFEGDTLADPALQRLVELGEAKAGLKKVAVAHEDAPAAGSGAC